MPDGAEHWLLVVPSDPTQLEAVERPSALTAAAVTPRSTRDQRTHREPRHIDSYDTFGALGPALGAAAVVEGESAIRRPAGEMIVDADHRRRRLHVDPLPDMSNLYG